LRPRGEGEIGDQSVQGARYVAEGGDTGTALFPIIILEVSMPRRGEAMAESSTLKGEILAGKRG